MRANEFVIEAQLATFADGRIKISKHAFDRSRQRRVPTEKIIQAINKLALTRATDLKKLPPTGFVVKADGFQLAIVKSQDIDTKEILYTVATVASRLKPAAGQRIVYLEDSAETTPAEQFITDVYAEYPQTFQNNHVMAFSNDEFAMFELKPSTSHRGAVEIYWFQAYPLRSGVGTRAIQLLQDRAREYGVGLTLIPWDKGQVSQAALTKFYKKQGFRPTIKGGRGMMWAAAKPINEINDEDELSVSQQVEEYFTKRGYRYLGSGRDQIAFRSPRGTVVKVVGIGEEEREDIVKTYVGFFLRNQSDPHYPRIYNAGDFAVDNETYFVYEMEYLNPVSAEGPILEYLEDLMTTLERNGDRGVAAFRQNRPLPSGLTEQQVNGLVAAATDLKNSIGGSAPLDLGSIENLGRRKDGQIVIIDPFSL